MKGRVQKGGRVGTEDINRGEKNEESLMWKNGGVRRESSPEIALA